MVNCDCGSEKSYEHCCGLYISGKEFAPTPEALMRSRYTAYAQKNLEYIRKTMKSPAADNFDLISAKAWAEKTTWTQLEILKTKTQNKKGIVEFIAYYICDGQFQQLHEISEFKLISKQWFYVDGEIVYI